MYSVWEIHIGCTFGFNTEVAKFLVKVKPATKSRITGASFSCCEEAYYLDRTVHYIDRVGMDYIRQRVVEDAQNRRALFERLLFALEGLPDPWAARIAGEKPREYQPLRLDKRIPVEVEG